MLVDIDTYQFKISNFGSKNATRSKLNAVVLCCLHFTLPVLQCCQCLHFFTFKLSSHDNDICMAMNLM